MPLEKPKTQKTELPKRPDEKFSPQVEAAVAYWKLMEIPGFGTVASILAAGTLLLGNVAPAEAFGFNPENTHFAHDVSITTVKVGKENVVVTVEHAATDYIPNIPVKQIQSLSSNDQYDPAVAIGSNSAIQQMQKDNYFKEITQLIRFLEQNPNSLSAYSRRPEGNITSPERELRTIPLKFLFCLPNGQWLVESDTKIVGGFSGSIVGVSNVRKDGQEEAVGVISSSPKLDLPTFTNLLKEIRNLGLENAESVSLRAVFANHPQKDNENDDRVNMFEGFETIRFLKNGKQIMQILHKVRKGEIAAGEETAKLIIQQLTIDDFALSTGNGEKILPSEEQFKTIIQILLSGKYVAMISPATAPNIPAPRGR